MNLPESVLSAALTGLLALPGVLLAHRAGMRKQRDDSDAQFDARMLTALEQRDKTIEALQIRLTSLSEGQGQLYRELGAANAQIVGLERVQRERDDRERGYIEQIALLTAAVKKLDDCSGGSPCPLAAFRRNDTGTRGHV